MSLLVFMYHRASAGRHGNDAAILDRHFALLARDHPCVLPGEALPARRLSVCLTFDDAYVDFYATVHPLLQKHGLRALLAVPVAAIRDRHDAPLKARLALCASRRPDGASAAHCTWQELADMAATGVVAMAAHGYSHTALDRADADLDAEIVRPKAILAARTGSSVDSFVLPFGRFGDAALRCASSHYRHVFRIGSADNAGWNSGIVYRVDADEMAAAGELLTPRRLASYRLRRYWNAVRGR